MYKISIILPIYNVEEFISEAIESLLNQSFEKENIEILLIDDCSTDESGKIAQEYAKKYENIKYYCLEKNSGMAGKPRNIGIQMAKGKYIMFLDPDDYYELNACEIMYNCIEKKKTAFVTANLRDVDVDGNDLKHIYIDPEKFKSKMISVKKPREVTNILKHCCNIKIISRDFLIKRNIEFLEGVPAEDAYFTSKLMLEAKEAYFLNSTILNYRRRTTGNLSETNQLNEKFFSRMIKANKEIYHLFNEYDAERYYQYYYIDTMIYLTRKLILSNELKDTKKADIIEEMDELINYWNIAKLPLNIKNDKYNILTLFKKDNNVMTVEKIQKLEGKMKNEDVNNIRANERKVVDEIENIIENEGMYKISVIIPSYNVEKYITECLESIVNQTIGFENIQLIIVDDFSTDKTFEIAKRYEEKYSNCIVKRLGIRSGSAGKPRNEGIKLAKGKYLMFADSDDMFELNAFEKMYNEIETRNADFIIANWQWVEEDGEKWNKPAFDLERFENFKLSIYDYDKSFWVMNSSMSNKIFRREFINDKNIKCLEYIPGEDTYFSMWAFLEAKNVYYIKDIIYYYRQRSGEEQASSSWDCSAEFFKKMIIAYRALYEKFIEKNQLEYYRFVYARNMTYLLYRFIDSTKMTDDERIGILADMRWFYKLSDTLKVPACQKSLTTLIDKIVKGEYKDVIDICQIIAEIRRFIPKEIRQQMSKPYAEMYEEIKKNKLSIDEKILKLT